MFIKQTGMVVDNRIVLLGDNQWLWFKLVVTGTYSKRKRSVILQHGLSHRNNMTTLYKGQAAHIVFTHLGKLSGDGKTFLVFNMQDNRCLVGGRNTDNFIRSNSGRVALMMFAAIGWII